MGRSYSVQLLVQYEDELIFPKRSSVMFDYFVR